MSDIIETQVRGILLKLTGGNRSLALCAQMNYETENLDFIDSMNFDDVFFDLGACEGRFSTYAGLKGIRTISFEPEKMNYEILAKNISLNELSDIVTINHIGISDRQGIGKMNVGQPWAGGHQKIVQHESIRDDVSEFDIEDTQEVSLTSLDHFIESNFDIPFPTYIKIDVDGSELPFIKGAQKTLANLQLKGILIELEERDQSSNFVQKELIQNGFTLKQKYPIPNEKYLYNYLYTRK